MDEAEAPEKMSSRGEAKWPLVVNLANSIIGVSVLAMPFCMMECGILLCLILLWISNLITRVTCNLLFSAAYIQRTRSYETLALSVLGSPGKRLVELLIFLFLVSSLCAYFVVVGDLGPHLLAESAGLAVVSAQMRMSFMSAITLFIILPISLLRNADSLSGISSLALLFYGFFVLRMIVASIPNFLDGGWIYQVNWWRPAGVFQCTPIILLSMSCQTQLFVCAESMRDCNPIRMQNIVSGAVNLCCTVYILVGLFGYVAFYTHVITGDILIYLGTSRITQLIKLAFLLSLAVSFPLMLFPCRVAAYQMISRTTTKHSGGTHDLSPFGDDAIPHDWFRALTLFLLFVPLVIAILIPNVEFILGLTGSTVGCAICVCLPCILYLMVSPKHNVFNRSLAQVCLAVGLFVLVVCSFATLQIAPESVKDATNLPAADVNGSAVRLLPEEVKERKIEEIVKEVKPADKQLAESNSDLDKVGRQEPPVPGAVDKAGDMKAGVKVGDTNLRKAGDLAHEAQNLVKELKEQRNEQKQLIEEQKQILNELKAAKDEPNGAILNDGTFDNVNKRANASPPNRTNNVGGPIGNARIPGDRDTMQRFVNRNNVRHDAPLPKIAKPNIPLENSQKNVVKQNVLKNIVDRHEDT